MTEYKVIIKLQNLKSSNKDSEPKKCLKHDVLNQRFKERGEVPKALASNQ